MKHEGSAQHMRWHLYNYVYFGIVTFYFLKPPLIIATNFKRRKNGNGVINGWYFVACSHSALPAIGVSETALLGATCQCAAMRYGACGAFTRGEEDYAASITERMPAEY